MEKDGSTCHVGVGMWEKEGGETPNNAFLVQILDKQSIKINYTNEKFLWHNDNKAKDFVFKFKLDW